MPISVKRNDNGGIQIIVDILPNSVDHNRVQRFTINLYDADVVDVNRIKAGNWTIFMPNNAFWRLEYRNEDIIYSMKIPDIEKNILEGVLMTTPLCFPTQLR